MNAAAVLAVTTIQRDGAGNLRGICRAGEGFRNRLSQRRRITREANIPAGFGNPDPRRHATCGDTK